MKILVTGAAGFVGSNLCDALLTLGHEITGIDNFSYGRKDNMINFRDHENFTFIQGDLVDFKYIEDVEAEAVVHLASQKIPRYTNALRTLDENSKMLGNVIDKCIKDKSKIIFASTSDIYGKNPELPYHEESNSVLGPTTVKRWAYALSKLYGEHRIQAFHDEEGLEYTIMRFFGSYGPNQNMTWWGGPQSVFIQNIIDGKPIEIHGDGLQTRTFTYIEDTIQGIIKCVLEKNSKNEIFNIANEPDEEVTILDLAHIIWELMKGKEEKIDLTMIPYESFGKYEDVRKRVPSIDKIKSKLNYQPKFSLQEGMQKAIDWQLSQQSRLVEKSK
jgi:UDP-glucose 4-epimerase